MPNSLGNFYPQPMTDDEFLLYQELIARLVGIHLTAVKKTMLSARLFQRLYLRQIDNYGDYFHLVNDGGDPEERKLLLDLVTTHKTQFFRENQHFDILREYLENQLDTTTNKFTRPIRVWSAACSTGEEAYSIAMLMADTIQNQTNWEVVGSDIAPQVVATAKRGLYPLNRSDEIPEAYLKRFCLRGTGDYANHFLIAAEIRTKVQFIGINLIKPLLDVGSFDVIFLRNVLIYFDTATGQQVINNVLEQLIPGGYLVLGHAETLIESHKQLAIVRPTVYRKIS